MADTTDNSIIPLITTTGDIQMIEELVGLTHQLSSPLLPDQQFDLLMRAAKLNASVGATANAKVKRIFYYIIRNELWRVPMQVDPEDPGRKFPVYANQEAFFTAFWAELKDVTTRTIYQELALQDNLVSLGLGNNEIMTLIEHPQATRNAMSLMEWDSAGEFQGIRGGQDGNLPERMAQEIGATTESGEIDPRELAREFLMKVVDDPRSSMSVVQRVSGGWSVSILFYDTEPNVPRIVVRGFNGNGQRFEQPFYAVDEKKLERRDARLKDVVIAVRSLPEQLQIWLESKRAMSGVKLTGSLLKRFGDARKKDK